MNHLDGLWISALIVSIVGLLLLLRPSTSHRGAFPSPVVRPSVRVTRKPYNWQEEHVD